MKKIIFLLTSLLFTVTINAQGLFISEVADPGDSYNSRFVELYNSSGSDIDFSNTVYLFARFANGDLEGDTVRLTGTIAAGRTFVIAYSLNYFTESYHFSPNQVSGFVSGNGDDAYALYKVTGTGDTILVDIYGEIGVDGTGTAWEYKDAHAVRNSNIMSPNTTWTASEWTITSADVADMTPGVHPFPAINNVEHSPSEPFPTDEVSVSATITDAAGVTSATCFWSTTTPVDTNSAAKISMTNGGSGDIYTTISDIPAQTATTTVYYVIAASNGTDTTITAEYSYTVKTPPQDATIYDIQYSTDASGDSPLNGKAVNTGGIVSAVVSGKGYYMQDAPGAWNGIFVYDNTNTPAVGDSITLTADVAEYNGLTELTNISNFTTVSSGNTVYIAAVISTNDINSEQYEGVLVKVSNAECTNTDLGNGEWEINDGSGAARVDDEMYVFSAVKDAKYDITGVITYTYDNFKIEPRDENDIITTYFPNHLIEAASFYTGNTSSPVGIAAVHDTTVNTLDASLYILNPGGITFTNPFYIDDTDHSFFGMIPTSDITPDAVLDQLIYTDLHDTVDFYAGILPLNLANNANSDTIISGYNATFYGVVTATDNYNQLWIQDAAEAKHGLLIFSTEYSQQVSVGDIVWLVGQKAEHFGATEIKNIGHLEVLNSGSVVTPVEISAADISYDKTQDESSAEQWEGQLVTIKKIIIDSLNTSHYEYFGHDQTGKIICIDDDVDYHYGSGLSMQNGKAYNITGVVTYSYDHYKINPRTKDDVVETSLTGVKSVSQFKIFPNPVSNTLFINGEFSSVDVINSLGQKQVISYNSHSIDVSNLKAGVYLLQLTDKQGVKHNYKFLKK